MRVATGHRTTSAVMKGEVELQPQFERLRKKLREDHPGAWKDLRKVARSIFGDAAFVKIRGQEYQTLALSRSQVRLVAQQPAEVAEHLRKLQASGRLAHGSRGSLAERAALLSRVAASVDVPDSKGVTITVATVNDDFTDRLSNLKRVDAGVVLVQEAKRTDVRKLLPADERGVHQDTTGEDRAGSATVWDKDRFTAVDRGLSLGVRPHGAKMLTRWITWTDLVVEGRKIRMISAHRPPARMKRLWPAFDANLARLVRSTRGHVVVGMDANQRDPQGLARATGLRWEAPQGSIDGFLVSRGIDVERIRRLPRGTSDHHPVMARLRIGG